MGKNDLHTQMKLNTTNDNLNPLYLVTVLPIIYARVPLALDVKVSHHGLSGFYLILRQFKSVPATSSFGVKIL